MRTRNLAGLLLAFNIAVERLDRVLPVRLASRLRLVFLLLFLEDFFIEAHAFALGGVAGSCWFALGQLH